MLFIGFWSFELWQPFWTLWLLVHSSYFEATLVDIVFWVVSLAVAMPAGALADRFGRKGAMLAGIVLWNVGVVGFGLSTALPQFALANAAWALGASFLFSSGPAYVYDTLVEAGRENEYPERMSRIAALGFASSAAGSVVGGLVVTATASFQAPLLLSLISGAAAAATVLTFVEPRVPRALGARLAAQIREGLRTTRHNRQLMLLILFQVLIGIVLYVLMFFRAPFLEDLLAGNYLFMGALFGSYFLVAAISSRLVGRILQRLGEAGALAVTFVLVFPPFALFYAVAVGTFSPGTAILLGILAQVPSYVIWGLETPVVTTIINRRVLASERATVLSVSIFFATASLAVVEPVVGYLATDLGLGLGLTVLATVAAVPSALVLISYHRTGITAPVASTAVLPDRGR